MTKPRFFTCTWTLLPVMDEVEAARFTAREGFAGMEIQCNPLGLWPTTASRSIIDELIAIGDGEGIAYTFYPSGLLNPATDLPEERARNQEFLKHSIDLAQRLGSPMLCIHPGVAEELFSLERKGVPFESDRFDRQRLLADARGRAIEAIAEWADAAAQAVRQAAQNGAAKQGEKAQPDPEQPGLGLGHAMFPHQGGNDESGVDHIGRAKQEITHESGSRPAFKGGS